MQNRKKNPKIMLKKLPNKEEWHEYYYAHLIRRYGTGKSDIAKVNTIFLAELDTEDTDKNRDNLRKRMVSIIKKIRIESEKNREAEIAVQDTRRLRLNALIERAENSDISETTYSEIAALYRIQLEVDKYIGDLKDVNLESVNEPSEHTQQSTDTGSPEPDSDDALDRQIDLLREVVAETENDTADTEET